jgi:putative membrane protein
VVEPVPRLQSPEAKFTKGTIMTLRALTIITALALPALATADDKTTTTVKSNDKAAKLSDGDVKIIAHLHHVDQVEIDLGKTAQKVATANVKSYGTTLEKDHQSTDKDLAAFAKKHGVSTIPAEKPETEADRQEQKDMTTQIAHLKTLKGADFDKEYLTMMVSDHDKEIARIDVSIGAASDPDLQTLLKSVKPVLQRHADQARDLQKSPQASANQSNDRPIAKLPSSSH